MSLEVEDRFFCNFPLFLSKYKAWIPSFKIEQGFIYEDPTNLVSTRVRIINGRSAYLTTKIGSGRVRQEVEGSIFIETARELLKDKPLIVKERGFIDHKGFNWAIDKLDDSLGGFLVAEIEGFQTLSEKHYPEWIYPYKVTEDSYTLSNYTLLNCSREEILDRRTRFLSRFGIKE